MSPSIEIALRLLQTDKLEPGLESLLVQADALVANGGGAIRSRQAVAAIILGQRPKFKCISVQDWNQSGYAYAPPLVDTVINLDHVVAAKTCESRGAGPWYCITLVDGQSLVARGKPEDLMK